MNYLIPLGLIGLSLVFRGKGKTGKPLELLTDWTKADVSWNRLTEYNQSIGSYTEYGQNVPDWNYTTLTLGYKSNLNLSAVSIEPMGSYLNNIDHSDYFDDFIRDTKPWVSSLFILLSQTRAIFEPWSRGLCLAIVDHESNGNPYAKNVNTNGTVDRGLGQLNSATVEDPSWSCTWKTKAMTQGQWLLYHPVVNLRVMKALIAFHRKGKAVTSVCAFLRAYAGGNQFFSPVEKYHKLLSIIALSNDILV